MPDYRRILIPGITYFFTVVTCKRREILVIHESRQMLRAVIDEVRRLHPFTVSGWVLLPDHIHCIWTLPENDCDYSKRWGMIKAGFSKRAKHLFHRNEWMSDSKRKHREAAVWQRRFWEHMIRDEDDFRRHLDYLHFNPVKHGLVKCVRDWPHSTFHRFVKDGFYPQDWGIIYGFPGREISVNISRIPDLPTPKSPPGRGLRGGFPPKMGLSNLYRLLL